MTELTQGNIDDSHIYLRRSFDRFLADAIGGSNRACRPDRTRARLMRGLDGARPNDPG